jgi:putative oxidoreductase
MAYGILFLRVIVGLLLFGHGAQKLFGWFGGHGPRGTAGFFGSLGFRRQHALPMAVMAGLSEAAGLLFALGFLTPFAALAMASVMVVAVGTVHWKNGLWATGGGYEFNLVLWAVAVAVAASGPGRFSLDSAFGWVDNLSGVWWGAGVLVASLVGGALVLALRERQLPAEDTDAAIARDTEREETLVH